MTETTPIDPTVRRRNRIALVALILVFVLPFMAAGVLNLLGWRPAHTVQHGILIQPPLDLTDLHLHRADGSTYPYAPQERRWHIVVVPTADCAAQCVDLIHGLEKVWRLQGRRAERLHVLWFGALPDGAVPFRNLIEMQPDPTLLDRLPERAVSGSPSVYLIDSFGFLAMRYPPGVDVADVRADIAKLLK